MASVEVPAVAKLGGKRENSGRRKIFANEKERRKIWGMEHKRIYLNVKIYETWAKPQRPKQRQDMDDQVTANLLPIYYL